MPLNDIASPLESAGTGLSGIATPLAKPSFQQRLEYGFDVETNLVGDGYRLLKAAVKSIGPTTFEEEREDIEEERLEAIYNEHPWASSGEYDFDPAVMTGRAITLLADPTYLVVPYGLALKGTSLAMKGAKLAALGAGVGVGDASIRSLARTGEIEPSHLTFAGGIGAVAGPLAYPIQIAGGKAINKIFPSLFKSKQQMEATVSKLNKNYQKKYDLNEAQLNSVREVSELSSINKLFKELQSQLSSYQTTIAPREKILSILDAIKKQGAKSPGYNVKVKQIKLPTADGKGKVIKIDSAEPGHIDKIIKDVDAHFEALQTTLSKTNANKYSKLQLQIIKELDARGSLTSKVIKGLTANFTRPVLYGAGGGVFHTMFGDSDEGLLTAVGAGFALGLTHRALIAGRVGGLPFQRQKEIADGIKKSYLNNIVRKISVMTATSQQSKLSARSEVHDEFSKLLFYRPKDTITRDWLGNVVDVKGAGTIGAGNSVEDMAQIAFKDFVVDIDNVIGKQYTTLINGARRNQLFKVPLTEQQKNALKIQDEAIEIVRGFKGEASSDAVAMASRIKEWLSKYKKYFNDVGISEKEVLENYFPRKYDYNLIYNKKEQFIKDVTNIIKKLKKDPGSKFYNSKASAKKLAENHFNAVLNDLERPIVETGKNTYSPVINRLPLSSHIDEVRTLSTTSANSYDLIDSVLKQYTINDIRTVLTDITRTTVKSVEFARKFGPNANLVNGYLKRITQKYADAGFKKDKVGAYKGYYGKNHFDDVKAIENAVNSYFGRYQSAPLGVQGNREIFAVLSTMANFNMMDKVTIANLGDLIQPFSNSKYWDSAIRGMFPGNRVQRGRLGETLGLRAEREAGIIHSGLIQENLVDTFVTPKGGSQLIKRNAKGELEPAGVLSLIGKSNQAFFKLIGLEGITNVARRYAYNVGAVDVHKTSKIVAEGFDANKFTFSLTEGVSFEKILANKNMTEATKTELLRYLSHLNKTGALKVNAAGEITNLGQILKFGRFKNVRTAMKDSDSFNIMDNVGMRAADRDAILPTVGNRLLFTQNKNPMVRILGQFSSWAMAKSTQTNAMIERIEDGQLRQLVGMLGALSVYGGIQELRDFIRTGDVKNPIAELERDPKEFLTKATHMSGNLGWLPTLVMNQLVGYSSARPLEFAPAFSIVNSIIALAQAGVNASGISKKGYDESMQRFLESLPAPSIRKLIDRTFGTNLSGTKKEPINSILGNNLYDKREDNILNRSLFSEGGPVGFNGFQLRENPETTGVSDKKELVKQIADGPKIVPKKKPIIKTSSVGSSVGPVSQDLEGLTQKDGLYYLSNPLFDKILQKESSRGVNLKSKKGAIGLMQIMPNTAKDPGYKVKPLTVEELNDPVKNVKFAKEYYNAMKKKFGNDRLALIAYNYGPGATEKWLSSGGDEKNLPKETRDYIQFIIGNRTNFFRGGFARARKAMTSNRAYSTNREAYRASQYRQAAKSMQKAGIKNLSGGTSTKSAKKIQEDFRNNNNNNNNNQTNETPTKTTSILDKAVETATDAVKNPIETGSRIKEKFDDYTQFELLDGDLDINLQKGTVEYDSGFGTFAVEGGGLLSAEPNIQFTFTKEFKKGGLLDKKRG